MYRRGEQDRNQIREITLLFVSGRHCFVYSVQEASSVVPWLIFSGSLGNYVFGKSIHGAFQKRLLMVYIASQMCE